MKKLLLSVVFAMVALATTFAADLNPFAYNLSSELSADQSTLTVHYSLNSTATSVKVVVMNGNTVVAEKDCNSLGLTKGNYTTTISTTDFPTDAELTWKVEVKGDAVVNPTAMDNSNRKLYSPTSIDIDNNPENENFGTVFVVEGLPTAKDNDKYSTYLSYKDGAGLYVLNADGTARPVPNRPAGKYGYNGGRVGQSQQYFNNPVRGYSPYRVRVSDDGRIFISSMTPDGEVLWEADPLVFSRPDAPDWETRAVAGWSHVMSSKNENTVMGTAKRNCSHTDCGIYHLYQGDAGGPFIAGPNIGFDVRGSGKDLKLLMLAGCKQAIVSSTPAHFYCDEYDLGTATIWNTPPSRRIFSGRSDGIDIVNYAGVQVQYDKTGNVWMCQHRGVTTNTTLARVNRTLGATQKDLNVQEGQIDYNESDHTYRRCGAIRFNEDFTQVAIASNANGYGGGFTVYPVNASTGLPDWNSGTQVVTSDKTGNSLMDFAWDYAGNLYIAADAANGSNGRCVAIYAMPHTADRVVSTPAATKYTFEITKPNYDNPENYLAPFAYDLRRTIEGDGRTKLHFMLNAHARKVQVVLIDETKEDGDPTKEIILREYPNAKSEYKDFIPYHTEGYGTVITTEDVDMLGLEYGKNYSWRVDVWGKDITTPNCVKSYSFYHPSAVDIDNNPENETFGLILTNEALHEVKDKSTHNDGTTYVGAGFGAGLYAFTADFKPIKNGVKPGFNGGKTFTTHRPGCTGDNDASKAHTPRRIRISDDGRIFVTSLNTTGDVLWEVDPTNLDSWSPVFQGLQQDANKDLVNGTTFVAGPNAGFDVRGSAENLQLLMLSANELTYNFGQRGFRVSEYNLGEKRTWSNGPSKSFPHENYYNKKIGSYQSYFIASINAQVQYDKDGGVWYIQYRAACTATLPALVHFTANGVEDYKDSTRHATRNAGFRFNDKFTKVIIAGIDEGIEQSKKATIYAVSKDANGKPVLTKELVIDMSHVGNNLNDFAWDYAGNLYVCGNSNEKVAAYVMPRSANDKVSTPAREGEIVNLTQPVPRIVAYNLTYRPNGATKNYDFSFYANTQPTGGSISFYKNGETTPLYVHQISNLIQGDNTVSIPMATLDEKLNFEKDITWELTLSAPESQVFGRIYKSGELNTAYATINTNPATDYFGHVYAGNQQDHISTGSGGNIYVWAPGSGTNNNQGDRYHTIKTAFTPKLSPNDKNGFTQVSAPGIAPDGKVYFTDNGEDGGVYVMDPKNYSITSFFDKLAQNEKAQYLFDSNPVGTPSSSAHIYWPGGNTAKLFLVSTEYYTETNIGSQGLTLHRHNAGYYIYPLTEQDGQWVHNRNWGETQKVAVEDDNIYQPNFTIVGTSHGAWYCQHRRNDLDVVESRSLMFFDNNGVRQYCSTDDDEIYGSCGSAIAVNKEETLLAMASGLGGIMFFDIAWNGDVPTLTYKYTSALNNNDVVTTLNFDYNGNLVATVGDSYNDESDKHRMVVFTMPKEGANTVTVPARFSQRVAALYADERMDVHFDESITNESPYQTVDVFRRLQAGMCNTICLPFSLSTLEGTPYENTKVFAFTGVTEGNDQLELQFSKVEEMQAGVPYLIQPENDITDLLRFSPSQVQVNANFNNQGLSVTQGSGTNAITFHGAIDPTTLSVNQNYLFLVANNRLATASAGGDMLGLRGYFTVNGEVPAKAVISFREGVTTGTTSTVTPTTDGVQKVLQNQQILIIRDGEIYNILGEHINTK